MDSPYAPRIRAAVTAIQHAAQISQSILAAADKGVVTKSDHSPVTVADFAIQALLTAHLHAAFPDDRFVGEEEASALRADPALLGRVWAAFVAAGGVAESRERLCDMIDWAGHGEPVPADEPGAKVWVFDPIDGTRTFMRGEMYAVNVALLEGGCQVVGVVGLPLLSVDARYPVSNGSVDATGRGSLLFAARGWGTFVRPLVGGWEEVSPRRVAAHAEGVTAVADLRSVTCARVLESGIDDAHEEIMRRLEVEFPGCDLLGWVPRWAALALGLANMTVWVYRSRTKRAKIWDHAGAMLLFEEVGGKITDVDGKDIDLSVGRKLSANYGFVAAPRALHGDVLRVVKATLREQGKL